MTLPAVQMERRQRRQGFVAPTQHRWALTPYGLALLFVVLAFALRFVCAPVLGDRPALLVFTLPVVAAAMHGGAGPALLATLLSASAGTYFLGLEWADARIGNVHQAEILEFMGVSLTVSWLGGRLKATQVQLADLAIRTEQRKDVFLAMLGHELRNPLAGISAAAKLLTHKAMDPRDVPKTADIINRQVVHMTHLINDLLDVSRVTRGQFEIEKKPVDLVCVLHAAIEQVSGLVEARQHQLNLTLPSAAVWVLGDNTRLVQVVSNLLVNAARYTPPQGCLSLTLSTTPGLAHISVQDNGIGIAPELAAHVFEFFVQAKRSTDAVSGGLGLGLSLVKSLVEAHGGQVSVHSAGVGRGSLFSVTLPLTLASPAVFTAPPVQTPLMPISAITLAILVVDDNRDAAQPLAMLLQFDGHRVAVAYTGQEALQLAASSRFDVAILDISLPDMDGYSLARRLRAMPQQSDATLIALTGYGTDADKARALDAGFDQHLVKPVDADLLTQALHQKLERIHSTTSRAAA